LCDVFKTAEGDVNYAWASAEIAVMGPSGAVEILEGRICGDLRLRRKGKVCGRKGIGVQDQVRHPYEAARFGYMMTL
jgi:acetyl-CoA carboxylase carboxyltransferase component